MYSPVFNYLAVNLAKEVRVTAQHSSSSLPLCFSAAPCSLLWRLYHTVPPHKHLVQQCIAPITFALGQDGEWPGLRGALTGLTGLCGALTGWEQHSQLHTDFMECTHTVGSALGLWESNYWPSDWCMLSSCASFKWIPPLPFIEKQFVYNCKPFFTGFVKIHGDDKILLLMMVYRPGRWIINSKSCYK